MNDYKKYIDSNFSNPDTLKTRDKAPCICSECEKVTVIYIANLKSTVKRFSNYKCRSCRGKDSFKNKVIGSNK